MNYTFLIHCLVVIYALSLNGERHQSTTLFGPATQKPLWSILICTLDERKKIFNVLYQKLKNQIIAANLNEEIEIVSFCDNRVFSVGYKRNDLLEKSRGTYICFLDDDDDIANNYIRLIYEKLLENNDCVSLCGIITINGLTKKKFFHSRAYTSWFEKNDIYYRPPNHLNPIKRDIAIKFKFPDKNYAEDWDWSMQVLNSGLVKTESIITQPYYFYNYVSKKALRRFLRKYLPSNNKELA